MCFNLIGIDNKISALFLRYGVANYNALFRSQNIPSVQNISIPVYAKKGLNDPLSYQHLRNGVITSILLLAYSYAT